jgi:hypothetical protein
MTKNSGASQALILDSYEAIFHFWHLGTGEQTGAEHLHGVGMDV